MKVAFQDPEMDYAAIRVDGIRQTKRDLVREGYTIRPFSEFQAFHAKYKALMGDSAPLCAAGLASTSAAATSDPAANLRQAIMALPEAQARPRAARNLADSALTRRLTLTQAQGLLRGLSPEPVGVSAKPVDAKAARMAELRAMGHRPAR